MWGPCNHEFKASKSKRLRRLPVTQEITGSIPVEVANRRGEKRRLKEFPNYVIYEDGIIINTKTNLTITQGISQDGYPRVCLKVDGKQKNRFVHRLLADTYIDNPDGGTVVDHINGVRNDNRLENLRWTTSSGNRQNAHIACPCCGTRIKI